MEDNSNRIEKVYFRAVGLQPILLQKFKECVTGNDVKVVNYIDNKTLVVSIEILNNYNYSKLHDFLVINMSSNNYGIYVSLVTDRDNDGVHLPSYVLEFYKLIGGNIDFSFVCG